jgi:DNA polymerase (family 10)
MALFLEMDGVPFKPRAYEKAALAVDALARPLHEIEAASGEPGIDALPAIGKGIAERIVELLRTGRLRELEQLREKTPIDVRGLTAIEGVGPKGVKVLWERLGIRDVAGLAAACRAGKVRELPHFGEKSEQKILTGIAFLAGSGGRQPLGLVLPLARALEARLAKLPGVERAALAGSVRRGKETTGDLDFLVAARDPEAVAQAFAELPEVVHVHARGATKTLVRLSNGMDADLRVVPLESFGAALAYFTGSKAHNVALRAMARARGLKLNEYGLFRGRRRLAGRTEEELYEALQLAYVPPELREDTGEIEAAREGKLPRLIEHGALRGDLQVQTSWTDGTASIEEMADAARGLGLEYVAITDHTRDLAMARGCDEAKLLEQAGAIRKLNAKLRGFRVLAGAEVNIREDGSLDVADEALARLEVVGAAVHSHLHQGRAAMTRRVLRAIENPHVDILFHPTARSLGHRPPVDLDVDAVIAAAQRTGTVLEIDAMPDRMDLPDTLVRKAVEAGVKLAIDSDAHQPGQLAYADTLGVAVARRGWARRSDVINALPVEQCLAQLKGPRGPAPPRALNLARPPLPSCPVRSGSMGRTAPPRGLSRRSGRPRALVRWLHVRGSGGFDMVAELRVTPVGARVPFVRLIADLLPILDESPLQYELHAMGTTVEGEIDAILELVRRCHHELRKHAERVLIELSIDDRAGAEGELVRSLSHLRELSGRSLERVVQGD